MARPDACSQSIDWYSEGDSRVVEIGEVRVVVRYIGHKGRRGRIVIIAPAGATFRPFEFGPSGDVEVH